MHGKVAGPVVGERREERRRQHRVVDAALRAARGRVLLCARARALGPSRPPAEGSDAQRPQIHKVYALEDARSALEDLERNVTKGKVIVDCGGD